jgi:hypothetical protein
MFTVCVKQKMIRIAIFFFAINIDHLIIITVDTIYLEYYIMLKRAKQGICRAETQKAEMRVRISGHRRIRPPGRTAGGGSPAVRGGAGSDPAQ